MILLIGLSVSLAERPVLRSYIEAGRPSKFLPLANDLLTHILPKFQWDLVPQQELAESDALNQYAQSVAGQTGSPINFIDSVQSSGHIVTVGFRFRCDITLQTILNSDPRGFHFFLFSFSLFEIYLIKKKKKQTFKDTYQHSMTSDTTALEQTSMQVIPKTMSNTDLACLVCWLVTIHSHRALETDKQDLSPLRLVHSHTMPK